jgi:hypothetical protein
MGEEEEQVLGMKADRIGQCLLHIHIHNFLSDVERSGYYTDAATDTDLLKDRYDEPEREGE